MKVSNFINTHRVVALSLCLLLLRFSYFAEAVERSTITDHIAAPALPKVVNGFGDCDYRGTCRHSQECQERCVPLGYKYSTCWPPVSSSNNEDKIDPEFYPVTEFRCCCFNP
ncbi:hypothetical protein MKW94_016762 [Papaver nudicaule]|uniref:Uncharacterized protein n=1 Tax=Papaver nudicaule TaxID=74823 RepID=A0AA41VY52_PAPNU|nr:hypothetical protein [Papaver nudicaule]